jgi:hypothetical protein
MTFSDFSASRRLCASLLLFDVMLGSSQSVFADQALLKKHCAKCHTGKDAESEFRLSTLGDRPTGESLQRWLDALDLVRAEEMPPEDERRLSKSDRQKLISYFKKKLTAFRDTSRASTRISPRRLNNREFENSVRDVLMLEDIGTQLPTDNLLGDSLHHGFDTHGETLGFSKFHLEQYIGAVRKVVDATVLSGKRPESQKLVIDSESIVSEHARQNVKRPERFGTAEGFDLLDPKQLARFEGFRTVPQTGQYRITIRVTGKDRARYDSEMTGVYDGDPIRMTVHMGDRQRTIELLDEKVMEIKLDEWLAAGTRFRLQHPTDGLKMRGNGNFKFQNAITGDYLKENDPERYSKIVADIKPSKSGKVRRPQDWHVWVDYWMGPRPRVFDAVVEGPYYKSWPPKRQVALLGENPRTEDAAEILEPIAERAWRRKVRSGELDRIVGLVHAKAKELGDVEALKEGLVSILVSPQFLLLNTEDDVAGERFASKFSYFLSSTIPNERLRRSVADRELASFAGVRAEVQRRLDQSAADSFLRAFPYAWLELSDINFMAPDPDKFHHYHRKDVSDDMIGEVLHFFRHAVENNVPIPELLSANYSFVNADVAKVYQLDDVPEDSKFRKYVFKDGRRGGLLGMGAFLTVTADSLATSPIHRAIYVMENFMGIHPTPPPPDVEIAEPDVRQAKTIKEILNKHRSDPNCASCHLAIDPFGYAFENFDPSGAWRDVYTIVSAESADTSDSQVKAAKKDRRRSAQPTIPIDASSKFRNGTEYRNIVEYRKHILTDANRDRFVRCFITKLLTYANGVEPGALDFVEVDKILERSAEYDYRIVDTIAAVVDSSLFRDQ